MKKAMGMKRILLTITGMTLLLMACELETSTNGDLDGFWQLTQVDTLATGAQTDMKATGVTWSFQGRIMELRIANKQSDERPIICQFSYNGDSLRVFNPYIIDRVKDDIKITDVTPMQCYGFSQPEETFFFQQLSSNTMILRSKYLRLSFRKY